MIAPPRRALLAAALATPALAQSPWPNRPIRIVVTLSPGSTSDILARLLADELSRDLRQQVIIENRPGAGGNVAAEYVMRAAPDGYTLLLGATGPMIFNSVTNDRLSYDPVRDLVTISIAASFPLVLAVSADMPFRTLQDLIAFAKANPDRANYSTSSAGFQMATELFNLRAGTRFAFVAYRSSVESVSAVASREVTMSLVDIGPAVPAMQAGRVRSLAITSAERMAAFPDIPTMKELGFPELTLVLWSGLIAPAATPEPIVRRLNEEIIRANQAPEMRERLRALSIDPVGSSTEEARTAVVQGIAFWRGVVQEAGLRFER
jgi:tripartite-type tricarboxylate transporter receptor subunit TctC